MLTSIEFQFGHKKVGRNSTVAEIKPEEKLTGCLSVFDSLNLEDEFTRRVAVKPLYDYFQILVYEVAWRFCDQDKNCLRNQGLEARWNMLNNIPSLIEEPEKWKKMIQQIQNMRARVDHNDDYMPGKAALEDLRKEIPDFTGWLLKTGRKYYEKSKNFSLVEKYLSSSHWYVGRADWIIDQYGEEIPFSVKTDIEKQEYKTLKPLREKVAARCLEIHTVEDLKNEDLDSLIQLITQTERIDAQETILLHFRICPKCGSKIVESHKYVGGGYDSEPTAIIYRIGCEKCDYELNNEAIDI